MTNTPENKSVPCKGSEEKVTPFLSDLTPRTTGELAKATSRPNKEKRGA